MPVDSQQKVDGCDEGGNGLDNTVEQVEGEGFFSPHPAIVEGTQVGAPTVARPPQPLLEELTHFWCAGGENAGVFLVAHFPTSTLNEVGKPFVVAADDRPAEKGFVFQIWQKREDGAAAINGRSARQTRQRIS